MTVALDDRYPPKHVMHERIRRAILIMRHAAMTQRYVVVGDHTPEIRDEGLWPDDGLGNMRLDSGHYGATDAAR